MRTEPWYVRDTLHAGPRSGATPSDALQAPMRSDRAQGTGTPLALQPQAGVAVGWFRIPGLRTASSVSAPR